MWRLLCSITRWHISTVFDTCLVEVQRQTQCMTGDTYAYSHTVVSRAMSYSFYTANPSSGKWRKKLHEVMREHNDIITLLRHKAGLLTRDLTMAASLSSTLDLRLTEPWLTRAKTHSNQDRHDSLMGSKHWTRRQGSTHSAQTKSNDVST